MAAFDIAEQHPFFKVGERTKLKKIAMRTFVMICITCIALIIPDFTVFLDIAGALGAGVIAFILPPLLFNQLPMVSQPLSPLLRAWFLL